MWCCYNAVSFLQNYHNRHPIACPLGQDIGCFLWLLILMHGLLQSLLCWAHNCITIGPRCNGTWLYNIIIKVRKHGRKHGLMQGLSDAQHTYVPSQICWWKHLQHSRKILKRKIYFESEKKKICDLLYMDVCNYSFNEDIWTDCHILLCNVIWSGVTIKWIGLNIFFQPDYRQITNCSMICDR